MGFFVEEMKFSQLSAGDYIEFVNEISGNDECGTVVFTGPNGIVVLQYDDELDGDTEFCYDSSDISNITKIK